MRRKALLSMFVGLLLVGAYAAYAVSQPKLPEIREQPRKCNEIPTGRVIMVEDATGVVRDIAMEDILRIIKRNPMLNERTKNADLSKMILKVSLLRINDELVTRTVAAIPLNETEAVVIIRDTRSTGARVELEREQYVGILLVSKNHVKIFYSGGGVTPTVSDWKCLSQVCTSDSQCPSGYMCTSACGEECLEWDTLCLYYAGLTHGVLCGGCLSGNIPACLACLLAAGISPWICCEEWEQRCGQRMLSPGP